MQETVPTTLERRIAELESALAEASARAADAAAKAEVLARDNERLAADNGRLQSDNTSLELEVASLESALARERAEHEKLVSMIMLANARAYGARSEKVRPEQYSLFNDMESAFAPEAPEPAAEEVAAGEQAKEKKPRKKRECVDWSKYDTVVIDHGFDEKQACPACGSEMSDMGYQVKRVFKIVPAHVIVEEHRQAKAVCRACSRANEADGGQTPVQIVRADMPAVTPVEGSCASASLVAYIMDRKYCMGMPLYRISSDLKAACNLTVSRQAMAGWVIESWKTWLSPVRDHMKARLTEHSRLHIDESRVQVLKEPGRRPESMSWAWVFCTAGRDGPPIYIFNYNPSRGHEVPHAFLPKGWKGTIITDGHTAYGTLMDKRPGDIVRVSCLVHILRKFKDVLKGAKKPVRNSAAEKAIVMIDRMFAVDNGFDGLPADERKKMREAELRPLMDEFSKWIAEIAPQVEEGTLLHKAVVYAQNQFPYLYNALSDGDLPIENNRAEQAIRPFALGRRAWLFSDTQAGARASCGIYSIVTTARGSGLAPMRYLEWLLAELPNTPGADDPAVLERFMPWSPDVPASCRMTPAEAAEPDPMAEPLIDVDPHAPDED